MKIAVLGAGRMGAEVMRAIGRADDCRLTGLWARSGNPILDRDLSELAGRDAEQAQASDDLDAVIVAADVAIDFSLPRATRIVAEACVKAGTPLVCGVTGLDDEALDALDAASDRIPLLYDRNMSTGIAVLGRLVEEAAGALGPEYQAEIHETHHVHKKDAPSGTALKLGEVLAAARGQVFAAVSHYDPADTGDSGPGGSIVFRVTRRGEVPGEHSVRFVSAEESLELRHAVVSRAVFADGALHAARWLVTQAPGLYSARDALA